MVAMPKSKMNIVVPGGVVVIGDWRSTCANCGDSVVGDFRKCECGEEFKYAALDYFSADPD